MKLLLVDPATTARTMPAAERRSLRQGSAIRRSVS